MPEPPGLVRGLLRFSQEVLGGFKHLARSPELLAALRVELNLPPGQADLAAVNAQIEQLDSKYRAYDAMPEESLALDDQALEFLSGATQYVELVELMFVGKRPDAEDPRTYADIAYTLITIIASESVLRPKYPWLWTLLRLLMLGYERVEEVPRFDPFHVFERMLGKASKVTQPGFGPMEAIGGLLIPPFVSVLDLAMAGTFDDQRRTALLGYKKGRPYLAGDFDYKLGWEPAANHPDEVAEALVRSLSVSYEGKLKFHEEEQKEYALGVVLTALALQAEDGGPGFLIRYGGTGEFKQEFPPAAEGVIKRSLEFKAVGGPGADWLWNTDKGTIDYLGGSGGAPYTELAFKWEGTEATPALRFGARDKSRIDFPIIKTGIEVSSESVHALLEVKRGELVLKLGDVSAFAALGADKLGGRFDVKVKLGSKGLAFEGDSGLKIRLASNAALPFAIRLDYVDLEVGLSDKKGLKLDVSVAAKFKIGSFVASIDRTGVALTINKDDAWFRFNPPKGVGLRLDFALVSGGGFLLLDYDKGEFAGAVQLAIKGGFTISAIVIITTKIPEAKTEFALFVVGYFRFPPPQLELGLRFTLNAVGVMIGIQHAFDRLALEKALPSGAMDDVLFPEDVVGDAPRIIQSLRSIFPIQPGAWLIGLMAELGWGSDELCSLRIALVVPYDDDESGKGIRRVALLGRIAVTAFKSVPKAVRLQLIGDFVGEVGFDPFSIRFYARLRDSRIGPLTLEGAYAVSLVTGSNPRLIFAAGGFHPNYKEVPSDLPTLIDRLAVTWNIGVVKAWARAYFAIAPGTVQFGAEVGILYVFGPLRVGGEIGLDVLIKLPPDFSFEASVHAAVYVKFRGRELLGIALEFTLWGPSAWRAKGVGHFTFIFVKIPIRFDERWGDKIELKLSMTNVAQLVAADLKENSHWHIEMAPGVHVGVLLSEAIASDAQAPVHPLSTVSFVQRRVPFGLELQRYGTGGIDGVKLFPVPTVTDAGGEPIGATAVVTEMFAVSEFLTLSEEDRLAKPGFQLFAAGVTVGGVGYATPAAQFNTTAPLEFEEVFRDTADRGTVKFEHFDRDAVTRIAASESAGLSVLRFRDKLADATVAPVGVQKPAWVAVEPEALVPDAMVAADNAWTARSPTLVASLHQAARRGLMVVEAFESEAA
jgi:hypothetical protein